MLGCGTIYGARLTNFLPPHPLNLKFATCGKFEVEGVGYCALPFFVVLVKLFCNKTSND
jgi:hypothetical protein